MFIKVGTIKLVWATLNSNQMNFSPTVISQNSVLAECRRIADTNVEWPGLKWMITYQRRIVAANSRWIQM
jgi:hypothetical protein